MAKKGKTSLLKKLVSIGLILILVQGVLLFFLKGDKPLSVKEAIHKQVESQSGLDSARKAQIKIQLAVSDFRDRNGKFPSSLNELVPEYFDVLPRDPNSGKDFKYKVDGSRFYVTSSEDAIVASAGKKGKEATGTTETSDAEKTALIASLVSDSGEEFIYDPAGKRDPFRPFNFAPKTEGDKNKTPLERYSIGQLKLTATLDGFEEPFAMVENSAGKGFRIKRGTKIGTNGGEVVEILKDRIVILETTVDFTGKKTSKTLEMRLRTKDQEEQMYKTR